MPHSLRELEAKLLKHESRIGTWKRVKAGPFAAHPSPYSEDEIEEVTGPQDYYVPVDTLVEAQGIWFLCPLCFDTNKGSIGTHWVGVGFADRAPPGTFSQNKEGKDSRWSVSGTGLDDLVLTPSIQLDTEHGCKWHGFVGSSGIPPGWAG